MARYPMGVYSNPATGAWFRKEYARSRKKLGTGESCVRFRRTVGLPLDLIGQSTARVSVDVFLRASARSRDTEKAKQGGLI